ncbi:endothelin-converting enzyme 1-like [Ornithodoros turicata]|uniref:endothelin-converting enzyme 1-like n=1 Tax=Ornithodoros turicata TaxID=34597 RepID=UPI003139A52E
MAAVTPTSPSSKQQPMKIVQFALRALQSLTPPAHPTDHPPSFSRKKIIGVGISIVFLLLLGVAIYFIIGGGTVRKSVHYSLCDSQACSALENMLRKTISQETDPCNNFYAYVCDGWNKGQSKSVYQNHVDNFLELLAEGLEENVPRYDQRPDQKAAAFFQACRRAADDERGDMFGLRQILHTSDVHWPVISEKPDVLRSLVRFYKSLRIKNLLNIDKNEGSLVISGGTMLASKYQRRATLIKNPGTYGYKTYYETFQNATKGIYMSQQKFLPYSEFVEVEDSILGNLTNYTKAAVKSLPKNLSDLANLTAEIPYERWLKLATRELGLSANAPVNISDGDSDYIRAFSGLLKIIDEKYLHYEVGWIMIQQCATFIDREVLSAYVGDFEPFQPGGLADITNRDYCFVTTEYMLGWPVYANFLKRNVPAESIRDIRDIIDDIGRVAFLKTDEKMPPGSTYTDSAFRKKLRLLTMYQDRFESFNFSGTFSKIADMGHYIFQNWEEVIRGLHTFWKLISTHFMPRLLERHLIYNLYNDFEGTFLLPPYAMMMPLYDLHVIKAVKYGALGSLIGSAALEMSHYYWWQNESRDCIMNTSADGNFSEHVLYPSASVSVAWEAYRNSTGPADDVRLRSLPDLTSAELFFVTTCYILCGQPEEAHPEFRCNEPLKHLKEFSETFGCRRKTAMNPDEKCELFTT